MDRLTAGPENVLYHYVQVDVGHGTFLASTNVSPTEPIIQAFRRACISIHSVLQNTVKSVCHTHIFEELFNSSTSYFI